MSESAEWHADAWLLCTDTRYGHPAGQRLGAGPPLPSSLPPPRLPNTSKYGGAWDEQSLASGRSSAPHDFVAGRVRTSTRMGGVRISLEPKQSQIAPPPKKKNAGNSAEQQAAASACELSIFKFAAKRPITCTCSCIPGTETHLQHARFPAMQAGASVHVACKQSRRARGPTLCFLPGSTPPQLA